MKKLLQIVPLLFIYNSGYTGTKMTQAKLEKTVKSIATKSTGKKGVVAFTYNKINMYLVSDVRHNRMRIITPIIKYKKLSREQLDAIMESNFHRSLDARYAVSNGILYSAYIHPLKELNTSQIKSAVLQVANLAATFGNQYSSGILSFGKAKPKSGSVLDKL